MPVDNVVIFVAELYYFPRGNVVGFFISAAPLCLLASDVVSIVWNEMSGFGVADL